MTEFTNRTYNRGSKARHMVNGLVVNLLQVIIPAAAVAGDTILLDSMPWDHTYRNASVRSEGSAGLTVDVGAREYHGESDNPQFFGSAIDCAAPATTEMMLFPKEYVDASGVKQRHQVYLTLGGTVTPGEVIWIDTSALLYGNPEAI